MIVKTEEELEESHAMAVESSGPPTPHAIIDDNSSKDNLATQRNVSDQN